MAPLPLPFIGIFRPDLNSPLQFLSNENDAGELTTTNIFPGSSIVTRLLRRQSNSNIIPSTYGNINSGPSPGTIVGIVLGSVGGFLILLWLLYTCMNFNRVSGSSSYTESVVVRDKRKSLGSHRSRHMSETVEVRRDRSRTPVRVVREEVRQSVPPPRNERVIVEERREERRETRRERSPDASDEVVVIEEHSPPRRTKSKRGSVEMRRDSGYRTVDPVSYGGGAAPLRGVGKSRKSSGR